MVLFDKAISRLRDHFDVVCVQQPASEALLSELQAHVPCVPEDLLRFFERCDGIHVELQDCVEGEVFSVQLLLEHYLTAIDYEVGSRFLPLRSDGCGDYDCLVAGSGVGEGAVVFWDHEIGEGPAYLLAGSLWSYLDMWSDYLVHRFLPNGDTDPAYVPAKLDKWPWIGKAEKEHPWPFQEDWLIKRDSRARELLSSDDVRRWLLRQGE